MLSHIYHPQYSLCSYCFASMELDGGVTHSDMSVGPGVSWFAYDTSNCYLEDVTWCLKDNLPSYSQDQKISHYSVDQEDLFPTFSSPTSQILHDTDSDKFNTRDLSLLQNETHLAAIKQDSAASRESDDNDASVSRDQWKKIAYPFELVKPGGVEGVTTLKDINHQIMMTPSKPIPHPVGDYATHSCISATGYGISGKAVAALTRIHTKGRGSITIVRTKG